MNGIAIELCDYLVELLLELYDFAELIFDIGVEYKFGLYELIPVIDELLYELSDDFIEMMIVLFCLDDICDLECFVVGVGLLVAFEDLMCDFIHLIVFAEVVAASVFLEVVDHLAHQLQHVLFEFDPGGEVEQVGVETTVVVLLVVFYFGPQGLLHVLLLPFVEGTSASLLGQVSHFEEISLLEILFVYLLLFYVDLLSFVPVSDFYIFSEFVEVQEHFIVL